MQIACPAPLMACYTLGQSCSFSKTHNGIGYFAPFPTIQVHTRTPRPGPISDAIFLPYAPKQAFNGGLTYPPFLFGFSILSEHPLRPSLPFFVLPFSLAAHMCSFFFLPSHAFFLSFFLLYPPSACATGCYCADEVRGRRKGRRSVPSCPP